MKSEHCKAIALRLATEGFKNARLRHELMAPNYILHFCGAPEPMQGRETVNQFVDSTLHQGFPDVQQLVDEAIADGDRVALRITYLGTHKGEFLGIPPTGKSIRVTANMVLRIDGDRVAEEWTESNPLTWMQQLGALQWMQQMA
jgi:hypothetical protein